MHQRAGSTDVENRWWPECRSTTRRFKTAGDECSLRHAVQKNDRWEQELTGGLKPIAQPQPTGRTHHSRLARNSISRMPFFAFETAHCGLASLATTHSALADPSTLSET
jgi:hypothetical protein